MAEEKAEAKAEDDDPGNSSSESDNEENKPPKPEVPQDEELKARRAALPPCLHRARSLRVTPSPTHPSISPPRPRRRPSRPSAPPRTCLGKLARSKWPAWQGHSGPPRAPQAASEGARLLHALRRRGLSPQIPPRGRGLSSSGCPSRHVAPRLTTQVHEEDALRPHLDEMFGAHGSTVKVTVLGGARPATTGSLGCI